MGMDTRDRSLLGLWLGFFIVAGILGNVAAIYAGALALAAAP